MVEVGPLGGARVVAVATTGRSGHGTALGASDGRGRCRRHGGPTRIQPLVTQMSEPLTQRALRCYRDFELGLARLRFKISSGVQVEKTDVTAPKKGHGPS